MYEFKLPELAENVDTATITKLLVNEGDSISDHQNVIELETEKASMEVPCPKGGVVEKILVKEGEDVSVGQIILKVETSAKTAPSKTEKTPPVESKDEPPSTQTAPQTEVPEPLIASTNIVEVSGAQKDIPASPSVRRLARETGVNITEVTGTGIGGRITKDDIKAYVKKITVTQSAMPSSGETPRPLPDFSKFGKIDRKPMNNVRKKTAQHLSHAWTTIPHVTQFDKANITTLEKFRKTHSSKERKLTITPFILKVMASALIKFPQLNSSIDMSKNEIVYKNYYNIGVAVDTERGLLVPVVRNVDKKSIYELTDELNEIAERARNKKTTLEEMQGGCFTLTNLGGIGGTMFTPIINWPEVAILGISRAQWDPVYEINQFVPQFMLPLSLSYDHRIIDGADGARFLRWMAETIEQMNLENLEK